ncbi:hypothetical protein M407DRAFT_32351 [Tulasnella calospora MUT 4182]|uniref:NFX1-type zinc finger-containing protein 1 n=1 Tax=Tulasnella calospora MUT 4182 TaxID=1051891 RepID=A0A0C3PT88_9AGAM|nr:hypothetical protein M407DRAFT_32351 [Tulasnella calospora MUT 4182]
MPPKNQRTCEHFRKGRCTYGQKCKFSHTHASGGTSSSSGRRSKPGVSNNQASTSTRALPKGVCRSFWENGRCDRGYECKYRHDREPASAALSFAPRTVTASTSMASLEEGLIERYVDAFSDGFSAFTLNPNHVHNQIKPFIQANSRFKTTHDMYQFAATLGSANMYNSTWDIADGQEFFCVIADPDGQAIQRIRDILLHRSVSTQDAKSAELSFQKAYLPVLGNFENVDRVLQGCIDTCMARKSFSDAAVAISGLHIFRVVSKCLYEYATRFKNAVAQHPRFAALVTKLVEWSNSWAIAVCASPPSFKDPIASWSRSGKAFAVDRMKKSIDTLFEVVESAEGSTLRRSDLGRGIGPRESRSQALLDGLQMTYDGPGVHHEGGKPRHDNDKADVSKIEVVPTHAELTCAVGPYLPANLPGARHHLPGSSMDRLVDIQFRLLREELIAPIRSSLLNVLHDLEQPSKTKTQLDVIFAKYGGLYKANQSGWDSVMFSIYTGVNFKNIECDGKRGLAVNITFDTPQGRASDPSPVKRAMYWESVGKRRLMQGGLLGLLWIPPSSSTQGVRFYLGTVTSHLDDLRRSAKQSPKTLALKVSFFDPEVDIRILSALQERLPQSDEETKLLIEAPIMFESIRPFLETLKSRPPTSIPFSRYIAHPDSGDLSSVTINPPAYVTPQFAFNLDSLFDCNPPVKLSLRPYDELSVQKAREALKGRSRLDPSQADAMINALTSEVSLIQGPPGTGKSFTGVELLRVLISNRIRPILLIAFTNHALDNIITHVLDKGLTKEIIRLGSRSSDETVAEYTLETIMRTKPRTQADKSAGRAYFKMKTIQEEMSSLMRKVVSPWTKEQDLRTHLQRTSPKHHTSLFTPPPWIKKLYEDSKDWQTSTKKGSRPRTKVDFWRSGEDIAFLRPPPANTSANDSKGNRDPKSSDKKSMQRYKVLDEPDDAVTPDDDKSELQEWLTGMTDYFAKFKLNGIPQIPGSNRPLDQLLKSYDVWSMSIAERQKLYTSWTNRIRELARDPQKAEFKRLKTRHAEARNTGAYTISLLQGKQDLLSKADLIGCTTNGAAKLTTLLQSVAPKVLLVEEAGQVLEAHIIASLVPSIEHLILIGDPLQLRPTIENYQLSMDNTRTGKVFRFDQSLMERLSTMGLHMSQLDVQRRMRPQIADLVRHTLYPALKDHTSVQAPPSIRGMAKDVFFLDHRHGEESGGDDSASKTNTYEAKMIKDLVLYFLKQGKYTKTSDIVVLCAYLGQLAKVRKLLSSEVATVIDERDAVQLINHEENEDAAELLADPTEKVQVAKRVLLRTVDNFQGEEGTIVILSLVRNSGENPTDRRKIGFLKSMNRANVALSLRCGLESLIGCAKMSKLDLPFHYPAADTLVPSSRHRSQGRFLCTLRREAVLKIVTLACSAGIIVRLSVIQMTRSIVLFAALSPASSFAHEDTRAANVAQRRVDCVTILSIFHSRVVMWSQSDAIRWITSRTFVALSLYRSSSHDVGIRGLSPARMTPAKLSATCLVAQSWLAVAGFAKSRVETTSLAKIGVAKNASTKRAASRDSALWFVERPVLDFHAIGVAKRTWIAAIAVRQNQVVDTIEGKQLGEIDPHGEELDDLIITLACDAWASIAPPPQGLRQSPTCPHCQEPIKSPRYGRVYKRADLDMSEQNVATGCQRALRLIQEGLAAFDGAKFSKDLEEALEGIPSDELPVGETEEELNIREKKAIRSNEPLPVPSKRFGKKSPHLRSIPQSIKEAWVKATRRLIAYYEDASKVAATTSSHVRAYEAAVATLCRQYSDELRHSNGLQGTVTREDMALGLARKHCGLPAPKADVRFRVEACWLTFNVRFHMVTLAQKVAEILVKAKVGEKVRVYWADMIEDIIYSVERDASMAIEVARKSQSNRQIVRTALFLMEAQYQAFSHRVDRDLYSGRLDNLKTEAREGCAKAKVAMEQYSRLFREAMDLRLSDQHWLKDNYGAPAEAIVAKWAALITRLDGVYMPVTDAEKREIGKALTGAFLGIDARGQFSQCPNGHAYVITECGGAMEESRCPECNSVIGGSSHTLKF